MQICSCTLAYLNFLSDLRQQSRNRRTTWTGVFLPAQKKGEFKNCISSSFVGPWLIFSATIGYLIYAVKFSAIKCMFKIGVMIAYTLPYYTSTVLSSNLSSSPKVLVHSFHNFVTFLGIMHVEGRLELASFSSHWNRKYLHAHGKERVVAQLSVITDWHSGAMTNGCRRPRSLLFALLCCPFCSCHKTSFGTLYFT